MRQRTTEDLVVPGFRASPWPSITPQAAGGLLDGSVLAARPPQVQKVTREKLPDDFGLAESNIRFGHLDGIVGRRDLRPYLGRVLRLFA